MIRITSGAFRGRLLRAPEGIRPSQDRVRKALFDVLGKDVLGRRVLDLFAGSGALGLEALSREAASALFVDENARAARTIRDNLATLGLVEGEAGGGRREARDRRGTHACCLMPHACGEGESGRTVEVWQADCRQALGRLGRAGRSFDLILMDPPYREGLLSGALGMLVAAGIVDTGGLVVAEAEAGSSTPDTAGLALLDERVYGGTKLTFWVRNPS